MKKKYTKNHGNIIVKTAYHPLQTIKEKNDQDFKGVLYNVESKLDLDKLKIESNNLFYLLQKVFINYDIVFSPKNPTNKVNKVDFLLAEVLFLERYVGSSRTILFNRSTYENKTILKEYYNTIKTLEEKWGDTLSSLDKWYNNIVDIKFIEIKGDNKTYKRDVNEIDFIENELSRSMLNQKKENIDIDSFIIDYGKHLTTSFLNNFSYNYILFCPLSLASRDVKDLVKLGAVFLHFSTNNRISPNVQEKLFGELNQGINVLASSSFSAEAVNKRDDEIFSQARKSAMSAIMSRNMSHNIGSHVLPGVGELLQGDKPNRFDLLRGLEIIENDQIIHSLKDINKNLLSKKQKSLLRKIETEYENDIALAKVNRHIQERMEFIADVNMSSIFMFNNLKLERIINTLQSNNFFLKKLSNDSSINISIKSKCYLDANDIYLSIPNDTMGVHAFYIIIENIIRNSIKHSMLNNVDGESSLNLIVQISESTLCKDYYCVEVIDDLGEINKADRSRDALSLLGEIQTKLDSDILKKGSSQIRNGAWGLFEMRYSASYLINQLSSDKNYNSYTNSPILQVNYYDNEGSISHNYYNLGYRFYIKKPKTILIVVDNESLLDIIDLDALSARGINVVINSQEILKSYNQSYELILIPFSDKKIVSNNIRVASYRHKSEELLNLIVKGGAENIACFAWKLWNEYNNFEKYNINVNQLTKNTVDSLDALFDSHGNILKNKLDGSLPDNIKYYEPFSSVSTTNRLVSDSISQQLEYKLTESINTQIAIIDERIQISANNSDINLSYMSKREVYHKMGVLIPEKKLGDSIEEIDLEVYIQNDNSQKGKLEKYLNHCLNNEKVRYIVIHLTLFELICKNKSKEGIKDKIENLKNEYSCKNKFIVFTSGRGTPSNLPENSFFLHYTTLQKYVIYDQSKYPLVQTLFSLRPKS